MYLAVLWLRKKKRMESVASFTQKLALKYLPCTNPVGVFDVSFNKADLWVSALNGTTFDQTINIKAVD